METSELHPDTLRDPICGSRSEPPCPADSRGHTLEDIDALFHSHAAHEEAAAKKDIVHAIMGTSGTRSPGDDDKHVEQVWVESV